MGTADVNEAVRLAPQLAYHVCDDLSVLEIATEHLIGDESISPEVRNKLITVNGSLKNVSQWARQFLIITGTGESQLPILDAKHDLVQLNRLFTLLSEPHKVEMAIEPDLWSIRAYTMQLHEMLLPIVANARDAMLDDGVVSISARNVRAMNQPALGSAGMLGDCISIEIMDTGTGIPFDCLERVFDPFFSTKGPGCGFGLANVHSVVTRLNGRIHIKAGPGRGTAVRIFLPACRQIDQ